MGATARELRHHLCPLAVAPGDFNGAIRLSANQLIKRSLRFQDATLGHVPRLLVVAVVLALMAPWMGSEIASFAVRAFHGG